MQNQTRHNLFLNSIISISIITRESNNNFLYNLHFFKINSLSSQKQLSIIKIRE
jgi:hypothetical protein